jgi:hypothetical protein
LYVDWEVVPARTSRSCAVTLGTAQLVGGDRGPRYVRVITPGRISRSPARFAPRSAAKPADRKGVRRSGRAVLRAASDQTRDEVVVRVTDFRDGDYFEIRAEPTQALDVYYHPFAYRDVSTVGDGSRSAV